MVTEYQKFLPGLSSPGKPVSKPDMNAATAIAILVGMIFAASAAVAGLSIALGRRANRRGPQHQRAHVTPTGIALLECLAAVLGSGAATQQLAPESALGQLLGTQSGVATALAICGLVFALAAAALERAGHRVFRKPGKRHA